MIFRKRSFFLSDWPWTSVYPWEEMIEARSGYMMWDGTRDIFPGGNTLLGTNISHQKSLLKMIFLFPKWDVLVPWREYFTSGVEVKGATTRAGGSDSDDDDDDDDDDDRNSSTVLGCSNVATYTPKVFVKFQHEGWPCCLLNDKPGQRVFWK